MNSFKADIEGIRQRARNKMGEGPITGSYKADPHMVVEVLNEVLATEVVCTLRYTNHYYMAQGVHGETVAAEFLEHAREEQDHASRVAKRVTELGGNANLDPATLAARSHAEYKECDLLEDMIKENLIAERIAIETYTEIVRWLGTDDPTTRRLMEDLLAKEEEHADDLSKLLMHIGVAPSQVPAQLPHTDGKMKSKNLTH
jgi:bacterioferritin